MLGHMGEYDGPVLVGAKDRVAVRLVALRVPQQVAAARRRKMRSNRDERLNPTREGMVLQGWNIFITNIGSDRLTAQQLAGRYRCRWRIETVSKTWKAGLRDKAIAPTACPQQALILLYAHLLRASVIVGPVWELLREHPACRGVRLSFQKTSRFLQDHLEPVLQAILKGDIHQLKRLLKHHCSYDRRARRSYCDRFAELWLEIQSPTPLQTFLALP